MATSTGAPLHGNTSTTDQKFTFVKNDREGVEISSNRPSFGIFRVTDRILTDSNSEFLVSQDDRGSTLVVETSGAANAVVCDKILEKEEIEILNNTDGNAVTVQNPANATDLAGGIEEDVEFIGRADNGTSVVALPNGTTDVEIKQDGVANLTSLGYREGDTGAGETDRVWQVLIEGDIEFTP